MIHPGWKIREQLIPQYRALILDKLEMPLFRHQAEFFAKADGRQLEDLSYDPAGLLEVAEDEGQHFERPPTVLELEYDGEFWLVNEPVTEPKTYDRFGQPFEDDFPTYDEEGTPVCQLQYVPVGPRQERPTVVYASGSFKIGKSVLGALQPAAALLIPMIRWLLVGTQYPITTREFNYIEEYLLSERGLNLPFAVNRPLPPGQLGVVAHANRPKKGEIWLELSNGSRVESMSWYSGNAEPGSALKGDEVDGHTWSEFYQFPNIECLLEVRQNLRVRHGQDHIPTTPDRPVVEEVINRGKSDDGIYRLWDGISDVKRKANPWAFNFDQMIEEMDSRTREKWLVHWEGKTGEYVGSVYDYVRGTRIATPETCPGIWKDSDGPTTPDNLEIPPHWIRFVGADSGTYTGIVPMAFDEVGQVYFLGEFCNYRYVGGVIERLDEITIPTLAADSLEFLDTVGGSWRWMSDWNSQFRGEFRSYGITLHKGERSPELRTEKTREFFQHDRVWFLPWTPTLQYEFEHAKFPDKQSSTGINRRISIHDHLIDPAEHGCAMVDRRGATSPKESPRPTWLDKLVGDAKPPRQSRTHPSIWGLE